MSPFQYAKQEAAEGRFPCMPIYAVAGSYYLCDSDWNILAGGKTYASENAAMADRSRILDRARNAGYGFGS